MGITYNEALVTYRDSKYNFAGTLVVGSQSFSMGARISNLSTKTVQFRSRISNAGLSVVNARGRIAASVNHGLTIQANIKELCATYNEVGVKYNDPGRSYWGCLSSATRTLSMRAFIFVPPKTMSMRGSIQGVCATYNEAGVKYNDPGRTYWGCITASMQSLQMRAFILSAPKTVSMRANILGPRTMTMRARMSRQQGWPIPNPVDPSFPSFQPTQLNMRGNITQGSLSDQTMRIQANIFKGSTHLMAARGRIVKNHTLSMRASIRPRISSNVVLMTYDVARASKTLVTMLFYTQGNLGIQGMSMGARIVKRRRSGFTGHFIVFNQQIPSAVIPFNFKSGTPVTDQQFGMRANVVRP